MTVAEIVKTKWTKVLTAKTPIFIKTALVFGLAVISARASAQSSGNNSGSKANANAQASSPDSKLDVSDLEQKYWASKDTDFSVVQNRAYSKEGRYALSAELGYNVADTYSNITDYRLLANYYFTERYGIELQYESEDSVRSSSTAAFQTQYPVTPNYDIEKSYYGASFNWIPIYAKMSFLNSRIIYFDLAISPGLGFVTYQQQLLAGSANKSTIAGTLNISQHFFFSKHFALRLDFNNKWFNEDVLDFTTQNDKGTSLVHSSELLFGLQYFF